MQCSEFHEHHCAYVDDTLAGVELVRMQSHVAECPRCAERDSRVRRSLMLVRSLPHIELSADFSRKLETRLRECREQGSTEAVCISFKTVAAIGAVASFLMLGYVAESLYRQQSIARDIVLPPVIAMAEQQQPEIVSVRHSATLVGEPPVPEIIASVSAGMPLWPATLFAEQGPIHFVNYSKTVH